MSKVTVLGGGGWAIALAKVLYENGHNVTLCPFPYNIFARAMAQPPPPNTVTFDILCLLFLTNFSFCSIDQSFYIIFMSYIRQNHHDSNQNIRFYFFTLI